MLTLQIDEALRVIERFELQLDDAPSANARRLCGAMQLLRAAALAFQDDSLAILPMAISLLKKGGTTQGDHAALTLCRLGFWRLGEFDSFCLLPRLEPRARWSKSLAISAMIDLSIEAAVIVGGTLNRIAHAIDRSETDSVHVRHEEPGLLSTCSVVPSTKRGVVVLVVPAGVANIAARCEPFHTKKTGHVQTRSADPAAQEITNEDARWIVTALAVGSGHRSYEQRSYLRDAGYEQSPGVPNDQSEEQCSGVPVRI